MKIKLKLKPLKILTVLAIIFAVISVSIQIMYPPPSMTVNLNTVRAATTMEIPVDGKSWLSHSDTIVPILCMLVIFLVVRTLNKIDKNQDCLFDKHADLEEKHEDLEKDFNLLKGKCNERTKC